MKRSRAIVQSIRSLLGVERERCGPCMVCVGILAALNILVWAYVVMQ